MTTINRFKLAKAEVKRAGTKTLVDVAVQEFKNSNGEIIGAVFYFKTDDDWIDRLNDAFVTVDGIRWRNAADNIYVPLHLPKPADTFCFHESI